MHDCEAYSSAFVLACAPNLTNFKLLSRFTISFLLFFSPVDLPHLGGFPVWVWRFGSGVRLSNMVLGIAWHGINSIRGSFIGEARSCDIFGLARLTLDFPSGWGRDRRRVYDGMHAFVYTPVFCMLHLRWVGQGESAG